MAAFCSYRKTRVLKSLFNSEYCEIFKSIYFEKHLWTAASQNVFMKLRNIKIYLQEVLILHQKTSFFNISIRDKFMIISWLVSYEVYIRFPMKFIFTYNISLNKRRSKVQEKNMSCECALNFDQWKTFSENFKPMRVWLWLVYKIYRELLLLATFSKFIQTQKRCPTSLGKICILFWKLLVISS